MTWDTVWLSVSLIRIPEAVGPSTEPYVRMPPIPAGLLRCSTRPSPQKLPALAGTLEAL